MKRIKEGQGQWTQHYITVCLASPKNQGKQGSVRGRWREKLHQGCQTHIYSYPLKCTASKSDHRQIPTASMAMRKRSTTRFALTVLMLARGQGADAWLFVRTSKWSLILPPGWPSWATWKEPTTCKLITLSWTIWLILEQGIQRSAEAVSGESIVSIPLQLQVQRCHIESLKSAWWQDVYHRNQPLLQMEVFFPPREQTVNPVVVSAILATFEAGARTLVAE